MLHDLKLHGDNFDRMESGKKKREYRLYDKKRRLINIGDTIRFIRLPDADKYGCCCLTLSKVRKNI